MELNVNIKSEIEIKDEDFNSNGKECDWNHCSSSNSKESEVHIIYINVCLYLGIFI